MVRAGSHSELEIWGVWHVFETPGMPRFVRQHAVALPFATVHLDAALPELRIAVELDGAAFHGSAEARERDTRRDVALAALGWVVLRFSYLRLTSDPECCRPEMLQVCAARQRQLVQR
jgi:very-short-patch-repair endonuclease